MSWYGLACYQSEDVARPALVFNDEVFDLEETHRATSDRPAPAWIADLLHGALSNWAETSIWLDELAGSAQGLRKSGKLSPVTGGMEQLRAPISPTRIFAAASNYVEHADEMGTVLAAKANSRPYMFTKASTCVVGPGDTVLLPPESKKVDWEVELAAVIGVRGRRIREEDALEHVAGYTVVNDISARDLTKRDDFPFKFDWFQGKCFDTFLPIGPWIVPSLYIKDPQTLSLSLSVNGETMQDASTNEMIFTLREQIAYLSSLLTLEPGDVIATGTPTGVGMGRGIFLKPGDVMVASIEDIGSLTNPVDSEKVDT